MPLPVRFTSLYRLVLRATSASVRHHGAASMQLQALYRPEFIEAAKVVKELERKQEQDKAKERWYADWEQRMYNTISLLVLSANPLKSNVPSRLTRNTSSLRYSLIGPMGSQRLRSTSRWNPQKPQSIIVRNAGIASQSGNDEREEIYNAVGRVLDEAFAGAEGSAGIVLGRFLPVVPGRRRKHNMKESLSSRKRWRGAEEAMTNFRKTR
ncbi:hypothetical protein DACRYDRAFT_109643 [Dacryopinax primogenitus]|uniref:Uncharacterized protein n=1 Tax=Dacryopinax primogenitus (strain DJM 731) TaxID=1858805 RepID=M5FTU0_DACPD|nr:uncharacterized protein DACRYDRAFT_109643 [Dacryopinax primogenitus]EJT99543.1 hypothetical protein DACRYDRAFT_109643 [Dacryopinax primogenitus]